MKALDELIKTVAKLRGPGGCPWDREQSHKTLKRYLIEEAYEAIDAIEKGNDKALMEELGDVLLQVVLHAQIASEKKQFTIEDVAQCINKKMITRHPHVFANIKVKNTEEVLTNWEKLKKEEKPNRKKEIFDGIPNSLPSLLKALKVSKKVAREGFEWQNEKELWKSLESEIQEFKNATKVKKKRKEALEEELGDLLFMIANIARWYKLDPEDNLNKGIKKFINRFNRVKNKAHKNLNGLSSHELNKLWNEVKKREKHHEK